MTWFNFTTMAMLLISIAGPSSYLAASDSWDPIAPREEIRPLFSATSTEGEKHLVIHADDREGLTGHWRRTFEVVGGRHYKLTASRKTNRMEFPRRHAVARLIWRDSMDRPVQHAEPAIDSFRRGLRPRSEPEFLQVVESSEGWDRLAGTFLAPPEASRATVELHFRWGPPRSSVRWKSIELGEVSESPSRVVRLATVHFQPRQGNSSREKCELFAPLIAQAADENADLVVLPESLTYYGTQGTYADSAETIPGPSTDYFGQLAKQHDLYLVVGLIERDEHLLYNVAVLIGPDGNVVGKYRKVCLPRSEIEGGIMPGNDYPVFDTRFGKVGMMVCYDGFFPEVARELSIAGADVIAWPVWGCNPLLARARACENHVYVVSSTYTKESDNWMRSAIYGHNGDMLAAAKEFGSIAIAEVDLKKPHHWHSLGDFKAQLPAHRPVRMNEHVTIREPDAK